MAPVEPKHIKGGRDIDHGNGDMIAETRESLPTPPEREWSSYQKNFFEFAVHDNRSAIINGVAGCAKTTSMEQAGRLLPTDEIIPYVVFAKRNQIEAQQRMPSHVVAQTFHAVAFGAITRAAGRVKVDVNKTRDILKSMAQYGAISKEELEKLGPGVKRLVGLAKNAGIDAIVPNHPDEWQALIDHHGLEFGENGDRYDAEERAIALAMQLLTASNNQRRVIDFDDMPYLAIRQNVPFQKHRLVMVDEAQDVNDIQRAILRRMAVRVLAVGDPLQSIYGFRGALPNAMELIKQDFDCVDIPLSINYRCGKRIVEEAKQFCPEIEAWDGSPEGLVEWLDTWKIEDFEPTDAILCRTTAPCVKLSYRLYAKGIKCAVLGKEIGEGLVNKVKKMKAKTIPELEAKLDTHLQREIARWMAKDEEEKAQAEQDKVDAIRAAISFLGEDEQTIEMLIHRIEMLFTDIPGEDRITLATIHKSKGLEWKRVFILNRSQMPSRWAKKPWQAQQEQNLLYVAITRAREALYYIEAAQITS